MPLYHYQALDARGKKRSGLIEAQTEQEAKEKLREKGIMLTRLSQKSSIKSRENLRGDNLLAFTVLLNQLLNSGVPLYDSLIAIEEQYHNEKFHRVLMSLCDQVKGGTRLSEAMSNYPLSFDKLYCAMIGAGEAAGALNIVLERLCYLLTRQLKMKKEIVTAMIYPAIIGTFALMVVFLLFFFVIPSIEGIFEGRKLNTFTEIVIGLSRIVRTKWWLYIPIIGGIAAWVTYKLRSDIGKMWLERIYLKIPIVRTLVIQAAVARFCRTMGTLLQGGVPMIDALRLSREVMHNVILEEEVRVAEGKIIEGSTLSTEFKRSKWIPHMVSRMLSIGEEAGHLVQMLNKIADIYEDEVEKTLSRLMGLIQPVILILMGSVIIIVLLAILLPMIDVSALTGTQ